MDFFALGQALPWPGAFSSEVCAFRVKKMRKDKNLERFHVSIKI
jgi:hypothetical protein